jgi:hypothetical protein
MEMDVDFDKLQQDVSKIVQKYGPEVFEAPSVSP